MRRHIAALPYAIWLLVLISLVPWRKGVYYEGGADPVVVSKAVLQIVALLLAVLWARKTAGQRHALGVRSFLLVGLFLAIGTVGALQAGSISASTVLSVRIILLVATIGFVLSAAGGWDALGTLLVSMGVVGLVIGASGIGLVLAGERLQGTVPEVPPNVIALLCGAPALGALHLLARGKGNPAVAAGAAALVVAVAATGSRTGIVAGLVALVVDLLYIRRPSPLLMGTLLTGIPALFAVIAFTPVLTGLILRSDGGSISTLNSRTIAWQAVLSMPGDRWERWIGAGLDVKTVSVEGQYWESQVLDSSWISALAQAGVLGTAVLGILAIATLAGALRRGVPGAGLIPAMLIFVLLRSFLENGLTEASPALALFLVLALMVEPAALAGAVPHRNTFRRAPLRGQSLRLQETGSGTPGRGSLATLQGSSGQAPGQRMKAPR